ncbi:hypothetical protein ABLO27_23045 [Roseibium sp. SCPC15]|uniref:hypothetical protein n=1 Tax=Roseibium sp. SCP15 TaxID=3141376 RepID=UPI003334FA4E
MAGTVEHVANVELLATLGLIVVFAVVGYLVLKLPGVPVRAYLGPMMPVNVGSVGLQVAIFALMPDGASVTIGFILVSTALTLVTLPPVLTFWATG